MGKSIRKKKNKALKPFKIPYEFIEKESSQSKKKREFIMQQMMLEKVAENQRISLDLHFML